jgi:preprotein translocase subunit SecD
VDPNSNNVNGYTVSTNINADPQFASYPSMSSSETRNEDVILPSSPSGGPDRYVLGPVGLDRSAIARARVTRNSGEWAIDLTLNSKGAEQWDTFAARTFHEVSGVVINGHVVSAPIMQPTQNAFTSFDGQLQISGGFTQHQVKAIAAEL